MKNCYTFIHAGIFFFPIRLCYCNCPIMVAKGAGPSNCDSCLNFAFGNTCVSSCPALMYADTTHTCQLCNSQCLGSCTGPNATQCGSCLNYFSPSLGCVATCPMGTYPDSSKTCQPCDSECSAAGCTGPLSTNCESCAHYTSLASSSPACVASCPSKSYMVSSPSNAIVVRAGTPVCLPCNAQCSNACSVSVSASPLCEMSCFLAFAL